MQGSGPKRVKCQPENVSDNVAAKRVTAAIKCMQISHDVSAQAAGAS